MNRAELVDELGGLHEAAAAAQCDVALLTIPFGGMAGLLKELKAVWKSGTVVIDTTVPLAAAVGGVCCSISARNGRSRRS